MTILKQVKYILPAQKIDMGGFPIKQALPTMKVNQIDPFLLVHHGVAKFSDRRLAKHQGIGPHPHRGFSPVTFVVEGEVHHRDSWGNDQIAKSGEVQWMHAGAGIIHSERPSEALTQRKGRQEIIQIWVNSPASSKMKIPTYTHISGDEMPSVKTNNDNQDLKLNLVAGNYEEQKGKVNGESPIMVLWGKGVSGGKASIEIPEGFNCALYMINGSLHLKKYGIIQKEELVFFEEEGSELELTMNSEGQFILLSGLPIDEPISQSGPYVMNTETEILKAMRDYQMGKMGILIEE